MTNKFVIYFHRYLSHEKNYVSMTYPTLLTNKKNVNEHATKTKNVTLEWSASKWKKNYFLFQKWNIYI